jgi:hypothetical protein
MVRRGVIQLLVSLAGVAVLAILFYRLGPDNILSLFRQIGWRFLVIVLIYGASEFFRAVALLQCIPRESRPPFSKIVHIRLIGEAVRAVTLTGPLLSEPTRAWFISKQGVRVPEAVAAAVGEYASNTFVSALLTIAAVIYLFNFLDAPKELRVAGYVLMYASAGYMVAAMVIVYKRRRWLAVMPRLMVLECIAQALILVETYWALISMGVVTSFLMSSLAETLSKIANVVVVGVTEGAYAFLFHALGLPAAAGFTLSLLKRLRSFAIAFLGLGSFALMRE